MKKLKLKTLGLGAEEILTRTQLKNILGGTGSGGPCPDGQIPCTCTLPGDPPVEIYSCVTTPQECIDSCK